MISNFQSCTIGIHTVRFIIRRIVIRANTLKRYGGLHILLVWASFFSLIYLLVKLIKTADQDSWSRSLSWFIRLKSLYKNSTHYNFSLRSLSERLGCSPNCLSHHLKILEKHGLIRYHCGNITFTGINKLKGKYGKKCIGIPINHKHQYDILRGQIIRFNLSAQAYNINIKRSEIKECQPSKTEKTRGCYTGLSAKRFGTLLNRSKSTGSRIRKKLKLLRLIKVKRIYNTLIQKCCYQDYLDLKYLSRIPVYSFYAKGSIRVERYSEILYRIGH